MDEKESGALSSIGIEQVNEFGERYFSNLNFNSFYKVSANDLYDRDFHDLFKKNSLYVIVGTDSGLFPKYIKQKGVPDGSRYIFIEPSSILSQLINADALNNHEDYFAFTDENNWSDIIKEFKAEQYFYLNSVHIKSAYCTKEDSLNCYTELCWYVEEKISQAHYEYRATIGTEQFIVQQLLNVVDNQYSAINLCDVFKEKTAFVLGGGPSLDDALPWLIEHRSRVVLVAVSRIAKRLLEVGLEPDFIVSGDPNEVSFKVSKEIYNFSTKPIFIHSCYVNHTLLSQWQGRSFYLDDRIFWNTSLNEKNLVSSPPTVSNTAIGVALQMGFSQIFLAGVDLCFTKDGFTHAQGSNEYAAGARFNLSGVEVITYDNTISPTALDYNMARDFLESQVKHSAKNRIYNISLNAAKVENIEYMPLSEIKLKNEVIDVEAMVGPLLTRNANTNYFHDLQQELNKALYQFKKIQKIAAQALKYNQELYNEEGTIEDYQIKKKLDKLERTLEQKYHDFGDIVKAFGLKKFLKFIKPADEIKQPRTVQERIQLAQELKERLDTYYNSYLEGSMSLIKLVERVNLILIAREEEKKESPNWDLIIDSCRAEKTYGRVHVWEKLEVAKQLSPQYLALFAEFKDKFATSLQDAQVSIFQNIKKRNSLSLANHRASNLFKQKKIDPLRNMLIALDKHDEPEKIVPYSFLIQAYLAELENDHEQALVLYQKVLEEGAGPLKEALLRILHLDFKEHADNGLGHLALECLAQLDSRYLVFYAESSRIQGNIGEAINSYIKYLAIFPADWQSSLNLAELFYQQKIYEGAEILVTQILEKHPKQQSALLLKRKLDEVKKQ